MTWKIDFQQINVWNTTLNNNPCSVTVCNHALEISLLQPNSWTHMIKDQLVEKPNKKQNIIFSTKVFATRSIHEKPNHEGRKLSRNSRNKRKCRHWIVTYEPAVERGVHLFSQSTPSNPSNLCSNTQWRHLCLFSSSDSSFMMVRSLPLIRWGAERALRTMTRTSWRNRTRRRTGRTWRSGIRTTLSLG